ncbi:zinc transporter ZIP4 isoform X2 [Lepisosteus oculatus]|uniref:zinc transporter ZIP4 isoform X2 n=1 Tax=Lepisosteus oculatus TaxID=7918 RepID=UPI0007402C04|nr:PREDICTED: zinc transporter ZIP4 isoform X3 [Lepisosteus oculatus]XP_015212844.1 PREDICTED: zinc transporter ZIP4 isoform X3 [Lepisosteus oculatus]XP_015212845.1 PREDICTED: zinc transporter ZIP4 isoform X3 [Lepisosteus oculatus]XP_015212846.1 PREDICTED: zinc transporter ZIP4 isoform X3 [Lepisosteus oculatus]
MLISREASLHQMCLSPADLAQLYPGFSTASRLDSEGFFKVAPGLCFYMSDPAEACAAVKENQWQRETEAFVQGIKAKGNQGDGFDLSPVELDHMLHKIERHCLAMGKDQDCFTGRLILKESNVSSTDKFLHGIETVFGSIVYHKLRGDCMSVRVLPEAQYFLDYIFHHFQNGSDIMTLEDLTHLMLELDLGISRNGNGDHEHQLKQSRSEVHQGNGSFDSMCFSAKEILEIYHVNSSSEISAAQFTQLSPALIQQLLSQACTQIPDHSNANGDLSVIERYIYASIATLVICLFALFGIVVLLCSSCSQAYQHIIQFCISLAVGSLTGDAILHLMPQILGLHVHSDGEHHDSGDSTNYIWKLVLLLGGIYFFFLMETLFSIMIQEDTQQSEGLDTHHCDHGTVLQVYHNERKSHQSSSQADLVKQEKTEKSILATEYSSRENRLLPYMITIGDGIHNFADGLAIGAAFSVSWKSGLATSLAVLCHEIPHELGDFAVLLHCGVSVKRALLLNLGSALTSFIGLYIALSVATNPSAKDWISAFTAGLFLYVALADMLPTMMHVKSRSPLFVFFLHNLGLMVGWGILLLLSFYEDNIGF